MSYNYNIMDDDDDDSDDRIEYNIVEPIQILIDEQNLMNLNHYNREHNIKNEQNILIDTNNTSKINIENIQGESQLMQYMDNHFLNKLNCDLEKIREQHNDEFIISNKISNHSIHDYDNMSDDYSLNKRYMNSNSPISISPIGSNTNSDNEENINRNSKKKFRRLTYEDIESSLSKYYSNDNNYSSELDILITYLKGQKNLYIQSKNITQQKLNMLIIPTLILSSAITIIAPIINNYQWSGVLISCINAFIAFFVSLNNYLKLESTTEMYTYLANQYDRLETSIEISSNKLFFIKKESEQNDLILNKFKSIENKLTDIKESTNILVPEIINQLFPVICHINIFSFIKKIEIYKKNLIIKFKDIKNEIRYIIFKWKIKNINILEDNLDEDTYPDFILHKKRLHFIIKIKEKIKDELMHYKNAYGYIDEIFTREIKNAESSKNKWLLFFCCKPKKIKYEYSNPVIKEYLQTIFVDD